MIRTERFYWAVAMKHGRICYWSINPTRRGALRAFLADWPNDKSGWPYWVGQGYRVLKVTIWEHNA